MTGPGPPSLRSRAWRLIAEPHDRWWEVALIVVAFPALLALALAGAYFIAVTGGAPEPTLLGILAILIAAALAAHLTPADRHALVRLG